MKQPTRIQETADDLMRRDNAAAEAAAGGAKLTGAEQDLHVVVLDGKRQIYRQPVDLGGTKVNPSIAEGVDVGVIRAALTQAVMKLKYI